MPIDRQYVLFDWDNTVRKGYTLYTWVDYLIQRSMITSHLRLELDNVKHQYAKHMITHDEYANIACKKYAEALTGLNTADVNHIAEDYLTYDRQYLMPQIDRLFHAIHKKGLDIIVISGAPFIVLKGYKKLFHIKSIYAFKEQVSHNVFTGEVECNYGFNKQKKVSELLEAYGQTPYAAFGDSDSDLSMLQCASHPFCINCVLPVNGCIEVSPKNIYSDVTKILHL